MDPPPALARWASGASCAPVVSGANSNAGGACTAHAAGKSADGRGSGAGCGGYLIPPGARIRSRHDAGVAFPVAADLAAMRRCGGRSFHTPRRQHERSTSTSGWACASRPPGAGATWIRRTRTNSTLRTRVPVTRLVRGPARSGRLPSVCICMPAAYPVHSTWTALLSRPLLPGKDRGAHTTRQLCQRKLRNPQPAGEIKILYVIQRSSQHRVSVRFIFSILRT